MTDTLPNIELPANTWVDLYAASGITTGAAMIVQNLSGGPIRLSEKATRPTVSDGYSNLSASDSALANSAGASGVWAYSPSSDSIINVQEA